MNPILQRRKLDTQISNLRETFATIGGFKCLKTHVVLEHMADCLRYLYEDGFGLWSEQAREFLYSLFEFLE